MDVPSPDPADDGTTHQPYNSHKFGSLNGATDPYYSYEFDATTIDMSLVARPDSEAIAAKFTLYLVIDRFTRACVGFYLDEPQLHR